VDGVGSESFSVAVLGVSSAGPSDPVPKMFVYVLVVVK
jgi:hypothetical protein